MLSKSHSSKGLRILDRRNLGSLGEISHLAQLRHSKNVHATVNVLDNDLVKLVPDGCSCEIQLMNTVSIQSP